jgi:hypothetical protein
MRTSHTRAGHQTGPGILGVGVLCVTLALMASGCARAGRSIPLAPAFETKDAAVDALLRAVTSRDHAALETLVLSESEFRKYVWPSLPASNPDVGMPLAYLWADTALKNAAYLAQLLADHGGRDYRLISVSFAGETTDYGAFRVHRETTIDVRGPAGPQTLKLFGSMIESAGRWKVYSFVVD